MNRFVSKNIFKKVYVYHFFINIFFKKNKRSKLCFGDRVAVLNDFLYQYGGSTNEPVILSLIPLRTRETAGGPARDSPIWEAEQGTARPHGQWAVAREV